MRRIPLLPAFVAMVAVAGCARSRPVADASAPVREPVAERCWTCPTIPMDADLERALKARIDDLLDRGGDCGRYGEVLSNSLRSGRISVRPTMWRHGTRLVAGEATPNGDMSLAREIDSLNVGIRRVDDVVWTVEHEAVHIAFAIPSSTHAEEAQVDSRVRRCRS